MKRYASYDAKSLLDRLYKNRFIGLNLHGRMYGLTKRIKLFLDNDMTCVSCKRKATIALLESCKDEPPHLGFYIIFGKKCGGEHKLTVDHIIPKSKGGKDNIENLQVMCVACNSRKGNALGNLDGINWLTMSKEDRKTLYEELEASL